MRAVTALGVAPMPAGESMRFPIGLAAIALCTTTLVSRADPPIVLRWNRFPWSHLVASSAAFGLGLSYATELPPVEVELEGESREWLVYWVMELTAGPTDAPWSVSLRLHHRSVAYGLMGDEGGMNALGLGLRLRL
jgi:hypothetical protein